MMIDCPSCATSYHVSQTSIGAGRAVVCPRCAAQWFVPGAGARDEAPHVEAVTARPERPAEPILRPAPMRKPAMPPSSARRVWRAALIAVVVPLVALALHAPLARHVPAAASLFAKLGLPPAATRLALRGVAGTRESDTTTLAVRGEIANPHSSAAGIPDLALSVSDAAGHEVYRWTAPPPVRRLAPGASASFRIDMPRVPAAGQSVAVRFASAEPR